MPPRLLIYMKVIDNSSCQQNPVLLGTRTLSLHGGFQAVTMAIPMTDKTTSLQTNNWTGLMSHQLMSLVIRPAILTALNRPVTTIVSVVTELVPHLRQIRM